MAMSLANCHSSDSHDSWFTPLRIRVHRCHPWFPCLPFPCAYFVCSVVKCFLSFLWLAVALLSVGAVRAAGPEANVVRGTLVGADGSPVAGATVLLLGYDTFSDVSDSHGQFCFRDVPPMFHAYQVCARRGNLFSEKATVQKRDGSRRGAVLYESAHLVLTTGKRAKLIVTSDATGKPLPGARAELGGDAGGTILTDKSGVALFEGLKPVVYPVRLLADGFAPKSMDVDLLGTKTTKDFQIKMEPGGTVRGLVVDETGKPIPGAEISFSIDGDTHRSLPGAGDGEWLGDNSQTDKQGRFEDRCVPLDVSLVAVAGKEHFSVLNPDECKVSLSAEQPQTDLRIVLNRPGIIRARVVDAETGRPVREFQVQVGPPLEFEPGDRIVQDQRTWDSFQAKDGLFEHELEDRVASSLIVEAAGYERNCVPHIRAVHDEQVSKFTIVLSPINAADCSTLRGQLLDDRGKGIAHAKLQVTVSTNEGFHRVYQAWRGRVVLSGFDNGTPEQVSEIRTDAHGHFILPRISPGRSLQVTNQQPGMLPLLWSSAGTTRPGEDISITLRVERPASVHVALDRARFPGSVLVQLSHLGKANMRWQPQTVEGPTTTDYQFEDLPSGEFLVVVYVEKRVGGLPIPSYEPAAAREFDLTPGENKEIQFLK
jgi:hypothetical protein